MRLYPPTVQALRLQGFVQRQHIYLHMYIHVNTNSFGWVLAVPIHVESSNSPGDKGLHSPFVKGSGLRVQELTEEE